MKKGEPIWGRGRLACQILHSNEAESAAMCWMAGLPRGRMTQVGFLGPKCQESRLWFNGSGRKNSHPFQTGATRAAGHWGLAPGVLQWSLAPRPQAESWFSQRELLLPPWLLSSSRLHHRRAAAQKHIGCRWGGPWSQGLALQSTGATACPAGTARNCRLQGTRVGLLRWLGIHPMVSSAPPTLPCSLVGSRHSQVTVLWAGLSLSIGMTVPSQGCHAAGVCVWVCVCFLRQQKRTQLAVTPHRSIRSMASRISLARKSKDLPLDWSSVTGHLHLVASRA